MKNKFFKATFKKGKLWLILLLSVALPFMSNAQQVKADKIAPEVPTQEMVIQAKPLDPRAVVLRDYLAAHNSPLQDHASDFVEAADQYHLDWRLVVAISGVESTFGKETPGGYNGWGWGVYGDQAIYFTSWRDGIFQVSKGLRENYIDKGLTTPYQINQVYAASPTWGAHVEYFLNDIDSFSKSYNLKPQTAIEAVNSDKESQVALGSAQLNLPQSQDNATNSAIALKP